MPLPIEIQLDIVIYAVISGIIIGSIFDLYRIIRGIKIPKFIICIQDILFWILVAIIIFTFLLYTNYAFLGVYVYALMIVSLLIYLKLISPAVFSLEINIISGVSKFIRIIFKNISYIIKLIYYNISGKNKSKKSWKFNNKKK